MASEMEKSSSSGVGAPVIFKPIKNIRTSIQKRSACDSDVSDIEKLADVAKDKIQKLRRENTKLNLENEELKRRTVVYFPNKIVTGLRNGLHDMFSVLLDIQTFTEQTIGLQETIGAKEKEAKEMICKLGFIASIRQSSTQPVYNPIMNEYEINTWEGILKNVSASATTHKTRVEDIKKSIDCCTGKLEKQFEDVGIQTLRKCCGKFISKDEFYQVLDSFMTNLNSRIRSSESEGNTQVFDLTVSWAAHAERSSLLAELIQETTQALLKELKETEV